MTLEEDRNILPFGDQNSDGYDDFLAYSCMEMKLYVFFGGNPIDTVPKFTFYLHNGNKISNFTTSDVNHDGKEDIIINFIDPVTWEPDVEIYYGGALLDTIPDLHLPKPPGASIWWAVHLYNLSDFNGDGYNDLVAYDIFAQYNSNLETHTYYFYSTYPVLDSIPEMIIAGDTLQTKVPSTFTFGDINGDRKTDIWYATINYKPGSDGYIVDSTIEGNLILGNSSWDPSPVQNFKQGQHKFRVENMEFIGDINGDGKEDIILPSYGNFTYYMKNSILYGNYPLDTIPHVILNTQNGDLLLFQLVGDVNGDGFNDFLSRQGGGYPIAKLWLGGKDMNTHNLPVGTWTDISDDFFGGVIKGVGDVNGDGVNDFCLGTATATGSCINGYFVIVSGDTSVVVGVKDDGVIKRKNNFRMDELYPNPGNPTTVVSYELGSTGQVLLKVYNVLGKEIRILVNESQKAGKHSIEFNGANLPSGVYFFELTASEGNTILFRQNKKLILIK